MRPTPGAPPRTWECAAVFVAGLALYLATSSRNLALAHDSIYYINAIDAGVDLLHPHHLLYAPLARSWLVAWRWLAPAADSVFVVSALNSLFGALSLCVVHAILRRRLLLAGVQAASGTALAGLSFGLWFYSTCVEVYAIPLFYLLLALYLLTGGPLEGGRMARVGLAHGLAILFHQAHVLFLPVGLYALVRDARERRSSWLRPAVAYGATLAAVVGIPYLASLAAVGARTPAAALDWVTAYAHHGGYWRELSPGTALAAAAGAWRATVGSHFLLAIPWFRSLVDVAFPQQFTADESYLVRDLGAGPAAGGMVLSAALATAVLVALAARAGRWRQVVRAAGRGPELLLLWILVYAAFFSFWVPYNPEFWIPQITAFWMLFSALWFIPGESAHGSRRRVLLPVTAAGVLLWLNLAGTIYWTRSPAYDLYGVRARLLAQHVQPGDLVVLGRAWILDAYVHRYSSADVLGLLEVHDHLGRGAAFADSVARAVESTRAAGRRVFVSEEAFELEPPVAASLGPDVVRIRRVWSRFRDRWRLVSDGAVRLWCIDAGSPRREGTR